MSYKVQGLSFKSEKEAFSEARMIVKKLRSPEDYVLVMKSKDYGFYPYMRVFKRWAQFIK